MDDSVIKVENLSKKFTRNLRRSMFYGTLDLARNLLGKPSDKSKLRKDEFWALKNINFDLKKGEILGIIGPNGSGKSTLLRLLTGIYPPDKGKITVNGTIGALIAVGAGFHPQMTGRENIYLNGAILGMANKELDAKFEKIVKFADINEFLDTPVANYSSGMKVRLGFSIAIHSDSDILLIDEVLSVGDINFRNKSLKKVQEIIKSSKGIIFISHNLDQVQYLCDKVMVMDHGEVKFYGNTAEGIRHYENEVFLKGQFDDVLPTASYGLGVNINKIFVNEQLFTSTKPPLVQYNEPIELEAEVHFHKDFDNISAIFSVLDESGQPLWVIYPPEFGYKTTDIRKGTYTFKLKVPALYYREGRYFVNLVIRNLKTYETYEKQVQIASFLVEGGHRQRIECILAPDPISYIVKEIF